MTAIQILRQPYAAACRTLLEPTATAEHVWKTSNSYREQDGLAGIFMGSDGVDRESAQWGTLALTTPQADGITYRTAWANYSWGDSLLDFWGRLQRRRSPGRARA